MLLFASDAAPAAQQPHPHGNGVVSASISSAEASRCLQNRRDATHVPLLSGGFLYQVLRVDAFGVLYYRLLTFTFNCVVHRWCPETLPSFTST
ncbi:hypothetical protein MTO96_025324 [Rhipicephalus appendiculatus]